MSGFLAYSDEDSDEEILSTFEVGESSSAPHNGFGSILIPRTLYSVRSVVSAHDTQIEELRDRAKRLEDYMYLDGTAGDMVHQRFGMVADRLEEAERGRAEAEQRCQAAEARVAELEQWVADIEHRMRAAVAALAAAFPPPPQ